jgi:hypothetical protein
MHYLDAQVYGDDTAAECINEHWIIIQATDPHGTSVGSAVAIRAVGNAVWARDDLDSSATNPRHNEAFYGATNCGDGINWAGLVTRRVHPFIKGFMHVDFFHPRVSPAMGFTSIAGGPLVPLHDRESPGTMFSTQIQVVGGTIVRLPGLAPAEGDNIQRTLNYRAAHFLDAAIGVNPGIGQEQGASPVRVPQFMGVDNESGWPLWGTRDATFPMAISRKGKLVRAQGMTEVTAALVEAAGKGPWPKELPHHRAMALLPVSRRPKREVAQECPPCRWAQGSLDDIPDKKEWICAPLECDSPSARTYLLRYQDRKRVNQEAALLLVFRRHGAGIDSQVSFYDPGAPLDEGSCGGWAEWGGSAETGALFIHRLGAFSEIQGAVTTFDCRGRATLAEHFFRPVSPGPPKVWATGDKVYTSFPAAPYPWEKEIRLTLVWVGDRPLATTDGAGVWADALAVGRRIQRMVGTSGKVSAVCYPSRPRPRCDLEALLSEALDTPEADSGAAADPWLYLGAADGTQAMETEPFG